MEQEVMLMHNKSGGCTFAFAGGLLVASCLPCEFVVVIAAITIIIICCIFRRRMC